ncbi:unnamed protein product [Diabrotica balteata]|uniref:Uncharacterized protein n=1 Tax=Diabrotica balteata TaxID=107213 RepID=A0A9N9T5F8_DIABA|nr:unnamed protein product [Diabrotica balteata]
MKWIVLTVVVLLGLTNADEFSEERAVLRRTTRQFLESSNAFATTENHIIRYCMDNGLSCCGNFQDTYSKMKTCVSNAKIFEIPKNEFIRKMVECSWAAVKETKDCLPNHLKCFPELVLDVAKSMVNYMYDDKDLFKKLTVHECILSFEWYTKPIENCNCLTTTSREEFCRNSIPATVCFSNIYKLCKYYKDQRSSNQSLRRLQ